MKADIITIGDEILIGQITDTNSKWIAEQINLIGFNIRQITSVGDDKIQIMNSLDFVSKYSDLVLITGGLGPTDDDITKHTLVDYFGSKLVLNNDVLDDIKSFINSKGISILNDRNFKQAEVPDNCRVIRNTNGTAPGMLFRKNNVMFISMPAVPFEMREMMTKSVIPILEREFKLPSVIHKNVLTIGIPESTLAELIANWETGLPKGIQFAYLPSPERIRLRLSMITVDREYGEMQIENEIKKLEKILGNAIYGYGDLFLQDVIGRLLTERNESVSTAESCTGGNIGRLITSIPGSSMYYKGGTIAYSNEVKEKYLQVPKEIILNFGAVSGEVVEIMAKNQRLNFGTDYAIAISGIAGPEGGTTDKPVGTTWIAIAGKFKVISKKFNFGSKRDINIRLSSTRALDMLRKFILEVNP
jgi:nicotinamide-nucleotide amidase